MNIKNEAIDTNQLVTLMIAKVTADSDWYVVRKSVTKTSIDTNT